MFWEEKIDLDQETALRLLENYFYLPEFDLKCETIEIDEKLIDSCHGNWQDQEENWHHISAVSGYHAEREFAHLIYFVTPPESEIL